jgi:large subunit ribosomal protein L30
LANDRIRIRLLKSPIGYSKDQKATVRALGLHKVRQVVEHPDNLAVRGMVGKVIHLVSIED